MITDEPEVRVYTVTLVVPGGETGKVVVEVVIVDPMESVVR